MAKICYQSKKFSAERLQVIEQANVIIEEYQSQGFDLTLRQLYYQFVARGILPNQHREYCRLSDIISDGRLAGLVDWDAITDRTRNLMGHNHSPGVSYTLRKAALTHRLDRWEGQAFRPEVWIEKDALVGVIEGVCSRHDVDYFSCRGYTSQSEMHAAAKRLERYTEEGQVPVIIHLGDHDPSGIDMSRDIGDRMALFMGGVKVDRIALNRDQVDKYNPPPNPAKFQDPRAADYIKRHGKISWELDALDPKKLDKLIERTILKYCDRDKWDERRDLEVAQREVIEKTAKKLGRLHD